MSTHSICFCGEIRKISVLFGRKGCLIWSSDQVPLRADSEGPGQIGWMLSTYDTKHSDAAQFQ